MGCCGGKKQELPNLGVRAANLGWAVAKWGLHGFRRPTEEVYRKRLDICAGCDKLVNDNTCVVCGCVVSWKAGMADQECPLKKWLAIQDSSISQSPDVCNHKYIGHIFFNQKDPSNVIMEVTAKCRTCGATMLLGQDNVEKLEIRVVPDAGVGT